MRSLGVVAALLFASLLASLFHVIANRRRTVAIERPLTWEEFIDLETAYGKSRRTRNEVESLWKAKLGQPHDDWSFVLRELGPLSKSVVLESEVDPEKRVVRLIYTFRVR